ncbi:MAG: excinuclease ABC subunit UvrC [Caldisericia bacterium]|nr:excinuclease ABC subunit UvrC [Caldisericia bacterium]
MKWPDDLKKVPSASGVYIFYNDKNEVIYVGKATSLKERLRSYLDTKSVIFPKDKILRESISNFDYIVTSSPSEALLLEANLIKKHKPKYNIRLKDDKSYPYLKIVMDDFPYIEVKRGLKQDNALYFGPFVDVKSLRRVVSLGRKIFKLRRCIKKLPNKKCIYFDIGECSAPCIGNISKEDYQKKVKDFILFIKNDYKKLKDSLITQMNEYVKKLQFEKAAVIRDSIKAIDKVFYSQRVLTNEDISFDVIYLIKEKDRVLIEYLEIRNGRLIFEKPYEMIGNSESKEIISTFISLFYSRKIDAPDLIITNYKLAKKDEIKKFLQEKFRKDIVIRLPKSDFEKSVVEFASENAKEHLMKLISPIKDETLKKIKELLKLNKIPEYIEGYDISNIRGKYAVGSLVVFQNGVPKKDFYRKFKIKFTKGPDDYGMLKEVFLRRFSHIGDKKFSWEPDLILIDGGKGQLNIALEVKKELNLPYKFISIAKENEILFFEDFDYEIVLPKNSDVLQLFQKIRDEAHRFAKNYFKKLLRKGELDS